MGYNYSVREQIKHVCHTDRSNSDVELDVIVMKCPPDAELGLGTPNPLVFLVLP
jgi:hypothetical protein